MDSNQLAIIVAYYMSRFDKLALKYLGFKTDSEAFEAIGEILDVKKNYVKFRRDEFDPVHPWRKGWQRPMDKRIAKTIELFQQMDEPELRGIVMEILNNSDFRESSEIDEIVKIITDNEINRKGRFILRGPTGKQAEEFFIKHFESTGEPKKGELHDTRELGCGYDFEIIDGDQIYYIEVKGLSEISGGILFTNKEWQKAQDFGDNYFVALVRNLSNTPEIKFILNPAEVLNPNKYIHTAVQIQWTVSNSELGNLLK